MFNELALFLAIGLTFGAVVSGIFAVGKQKTWDFPQGFREYQRGNSRALLYGIVIFTTCLSVCHFAFVLDWLLFDRGVTTPPVVNAARLVWHCGVAVAFIAIHLWAKFHRKNRLGQPDQYFWGRRHGYN